MLPCLASDCRTANLWSSDCQAESFNTSCSNSVPALSSRLETAEETSSRLLNNFFDCTDFRFQTCNNITCQIVCYRSSFQTCCNHSHRLVCKGFDGIGRETLLQSTASIDTQCLQPITGVILWHTFPSTVWIFSGI